MSLVQKFLVAVLPEKWAAAMESESRLWMARCPCGNARSIWELGGIRWLAAGRPRWLLRCPKCGERQWHSITREEKGDIPAASRHEKHP